MSELAFADLQTEIKALSLWQMIIIKDQLEKMIKNEQDRESDSFIKDGLDWLDSIAGSVHREIDYKKEREEWRDEKYGYIN